MKSIHFILFCFVGTMSLAQIRFNSAFNPCSIEERQIVKNADYYCHNRIINKVQEIQEIMWSKVDVSIPLGWQSYVCDNNNCYTPKIENCPEKLPNVLLVDSSVNMDVHFETEGIQGGAHVVLWVFEKGDTNAFTIESNSQITYVELMDIFGKKVASYSTHHNNTYDISHLNDGIYFVKMLDTNKQYISTLRLQKQGPRS